MNKYGPYELPKISCLKELVELRNNDDPDGTAFFYTDDDGNVVKKSYSDFRDDVNAVGTYFYAHNFKKKRNISVFPTVSDWIKPAKEGKKQPCESGVANVAPAGRICQNFLHFFGPFISH